MVKKIVSYSDIYPARILTKALICMGDYVYGYYRPKEFQPFYVGKGRKLRVMSHWDAAIKSPQKDQEKEIASILNSGGVPTVKLLAYNLERTKPFEVYSVAERVLEDAFGIQSVWDKRSGADRLVDHRNQLTLLQKREDSSKTPARSLDAVIAYLGGRGEVELQALSDSINAPILLVGISSTYHASYSEHQLADMARMYWNLDRFKNTTYPSLQSANNAVLLAWTSRIDKDAKPTIVGAWRIKANSYAQQKSSGRYIFDVCVDYDLKKRCLGVRLSGNGHQYQGPRITLPRI